MGHSRVTWVSCLALGFACGPDQVPGSHSSGGTVGDSTGQGNEDGASGTSSDMSSTASTSSTSDGSSTSDESSTGTWMDPDCPDIHEGDLYIDATTDVDDLRLTGRVNGYIVAENLDGQNLEFLGRLHVVEQSLVIRDNPNLTNLAGLDELHYVGGILNIHDNPALVSLEGVGPVKELLGLAVYGNASLASLDLPELEVLTALRIGVCSNVDFEPLGDNPNLENLDGLSALQMFTNIDIGSQSSLSSIDRLHDIAADGGFKGGLSHINHNPSLTYEDVELLIQLGGRDAQDLYHCMNLSEPETNDCICPNPG